MRLPLGALAADHHAGGVGANHHQRVPHHVADVVLAHREVDRADVALVCEQDVEDRLVRVGVALVRDLSDRLAVERAVRAARGDQDVVRGQVGAGAAGRSERRSVRMRARSSGSSRRRAAPQAALVRPGRHHRVQVGARRPVRVLIDGDVDALGVGRLDQLQALLDRPQTFGLDALWCEIWTAAPRLPPDPDRLLDGLHQLLALVAHVAGVDAAGRCDLLRRLDQLLGGPRSSRAGRSRRTTCRRRRRPSTRRRSRRICGELGGVGRAHRVAHRRLADGRRARPAPPR